MGQVGAGKSELLRLDALCSEEWDRPDNVALRARYAIFSAQRTGSEWLCDFLRQRAIGIPFEYFNHTHMMRIGARLGCVLAKDRIDIERYIALLEPLRSRHGIFGTKLQPDQLRTVSADSNDKAVAMLRRFDQVLLLRRRDRLLQAISLARAHLTNQWQLYGDDHAMAVTVGDDVLFRMIGERLAKIRDDDRYMAEIVGRLDPKAVRTLWYEDLSVPGALESIADHLWDALGGSAPRPEPDPSLALARKINEAEGHAIKERYLAFIGAA